MRLDLGQLSALWLQPGSQHAVYRTYGEFFKTFFKRFEVIDYRAIYLEKGGSFLQTSISNAVESFQPALMMYSQFPNSYAYLSPEFLARLGERVRVFGVGWDDEMYFDQAKYFYRACSAVLTTDPETAEILNCMGVPARSVLSAFMTERPRRPIKQDIPVSFVGDLSKPRRRSFIEILESAGIPVADFGTGSRNGRLAWAEVPVVFARSKINLNFTAANPPAWVTRHNPDRALKRQLKGRPFELAALGCFCLCEWAPSVTRWFTPGVDIEVFRDADELVQQVRRYLQDDRRRAEIAACAERKFTEELDPRIQYTRAFSELLSESHRRSEGATCGLSDPFYLESVGRSRGASFVHALARGAPLRALAETKAPPANRPRYWRGFMDGVVSSVAAGLRIR